jgi:hypothetical protein
MAEITYSNPRTAARFDDWPSGRERVKCEFRIHTDPKRGQRAERRTTSPRTGAWCKWKHNTYARAQRIVDGSDGRTYVAALCGSRYTRADWGWRIVIYDHALKYEVDRAESGTVGPQDDRYPAMRALFEEPKHCPICGHETGAAAADPGLCPHQESA